MNEFGIQIDGTFYEYASTLRVAYDLQGQFNHKPYMEVFSGMSEMKVEDQLKVLYTAFKVGNPDVAIDITFTKFMNYYFDNFNLKNLLDDIKLFSARMLGKDSLDDEEDSKGKTGIEGNESN